MLLSLTSYFIWFLFSDEADDVLGTGWNWFFVWRCVDFPRHDQIQVNFEDLMESSLVEKIPGNETVRYTGMCCVVS